MKSYEIQKQNDIWGLYWVSQFGWLRPVELGLLLWPDASKSSATKQANRLVLHWRKNRFVIERVLPGRCGRALVLARNGVRYLAEEAGIVAQTGKDIGRFPDDESGEWLPPISWKHDILAASFLVALNGNGWEIKPENAIRRELSGAAAARKTTTKNAKIPDGIATKEGKTAWIEVESSSKTGAPAKHLARNLIAAASGNLSVLGFDFNKVFVVYDPNSTNYKGYRIDHKYRITQAISEELLIPKVAITFAKAEKIASYSADDFEPETVTVQSKKVQEMLRKLEKEGWVDKKNEVFKWEYDSRTKIEIWAHYYPGDDEQSGWIVYKNGEFIPESYRNEFQEAKEFAASFICKMKHKD